MKLLIVVIMTATSYAGTIVPNIQWNQIRTNHTGSAAAFGKRSNVTLSANRNGFLSPDAWTWGAQVITNHLGLAIEADVQAFENGFDNQFYDLNLGYLIIPNLSVGIEYAYQNDERAGFDFSVPSISIGYKLSNEIILGAGYERAHGHGSPISLNNIHIGAGHVTKNSTNEIVLNYSLEDESSLAGVTYSTPSSWGVAVDHVCQGILHKALQVSAIARIGKYEGDDYTWSVQPSFEYMAANHFFPGFYGGFNDMGQEEEWNGGLSLRNIHNNFQWLFQAGWTEGDEYEFDLDLSYMF